MTSKSYSVNIENNHIKSDKFDFYLVQDGYYRLDGGAMYGMVPKAVWSKYEQTDDSNRLYMALNCLLAKRDGEVFLADTGIGEKLDEKGRAIFGIEKDKNLLDEIRDKGIEPGDVSHVILTHMHFDHAGWVVDNNGELTFPNARYYVQADEWQEALNPHVRFKDSYLLPYYEKLRDSGSLVILNGDAEIAEGVRVYAVPGHSKGHQVPVFDGGNVKIAHFGDVAAIATQVRQNWTCGFDRAPEETITNKLEILEKAFEEGWLIVTAHDRTIRVGELTRERGKYRLRKLL